MNKLFSVIKFVVGWPLSLVALFFVGKIFLGNGQILSHLSSLDIFLLLASLFCFLCYFFLRSFFWQQLLVKKGYRYSFKKTALIWGLSELKRYVPGNIWSFLARHNEYAKLGTSGNIVVGSLFQEVEFFLFASLLVSLLTVNFLVFGFFHFPLQHTIAICTYLITGMVIFLFIFQKRIFQRLFLFGHTLTPFSVQEVVQLLVPMTGAFFFYGLGTYFATSSFFPLFIPHILSLIGFFVFSMLVGYLSFITPMGLGVREAVVTAGISKYIGVQQAAFGAIFSRLLLIISELIFLFLCFLWNHFAHVTKRIEHFIIHYRYEILLACTVLIYIGYFTLASFLRYSNFFTGRFDLGNMDQTVWNTVHGRFFQLTNPDGTNIISRLAYHADFMLVLLAPFYFIWQDPRMLLLIQSIALGSGAFFVFLLAQHTLKDKKVALAFGLSYLLYPAINHANLYDFHAVTLAVPLFLAGWYFLIKNKLLLSFSLFILAATTKEEVWIITGFIGLYIFLFKKQKFLGLLLSAFSFGLFYYLFWHAIPLARGGQHFALSYYSDFGTTPGTVLKNIIFSPLKIIERILSNGQMLYLFELFAPLLFLPFLAIPFLLFIAPELGIDLLSQNTQLHQIQYHYAAIFTPFIFLAGIFGLSLLLRIVPKVRMHAFSLILIPAIFCAYFYGPLPGAYHMNDDMFTNQLPYANLVDSFLSSIPHRYSVAASNNVGSHLSHRQKIFTIPVGLKEADIVVFLLNDYDAQPSLSAQKQMAKQLDKDPYYVKLFSYEDFVVYRKKSVPILTKRPTHGILPIFKGN